MNYIKAYNAILYYRRQHPINRSKDIYCEFHHIIPVCCNGENTPRKSKYNVNGTNLIGLTAKEHYVCHHLLSKIYENTQYEYKILYAYNLLRRTSTEHINAKNRVLKATDRKLHQIRSQLMTQININRIGKALDENHKQAIAEKVKDLIWLNNGINELRQNIILPIPDGYVYGRLRMNSQTKTKISKTLKGRKQTKKRKLSDIACKKLSIRMSKQNQNRRWITNGLQNKFIQCIILPDGWRYGYTRGLRAKLEAAIA